MVPIIGRCHVAYLPRDRVVGISKLARLVDAFSKRLQIQERLTAQIADTIDQVLQPRGVGVVIEAGHQCMSTRGVHKPGVSMVTSRMLGAFRTIRTTRRELLSMIGPRAARPGSIGPIPPPRAGRAAHAVAKALTMATAWLARPVGAAFQPPRSLAVARRSGAWSGCRGRPAPGPRPLAGPAGSAGSSRRAGVEALDRGGAAAVRGERQHHHAGAPPPRPGCRAPASRPRRARTRWPTGSARRPCRHSRRWSAPCRLASVQ